MKYIFEVQAECDPNEIIGIKEQLDEAFKGAVSINVESEKVAHWEINSDGYYPQCSICGHEPSARKFTKYCEECGAKMDGEKK